MKVASEFLVAVRDIQSQCRRKHPAIDKLCQELIKNSSKRKQGDSVEQLLELLPANSNKKVFLMWLKMVEAAVAEGVHIDMACLLSFFDSISRAEDEELQLRIVLLIPKLLAGVQLTAIFLLKIFGYCSKVKGNLGSRVVADACRGCLERLFQQYFSKPREDFKQALSQLSSELEQKNSSLRQHRTFSNMVVSLLMRVENLNRRDFLERMVDLYVLNLPEPGEQGYQRDVLTAIQIVSAHPELKAIDKLFQRIHTAFESCEDYPLEMVRGIQYYWFQDFAMLASLHRNNRQAMQWPLRIFESVQRRMLSINEKSSALRPNRIVGSVLQLLLIVRRELFLFVNLHPLLEKSVLKPASEDSIEQLKLNFLNYFLHNFSEPLSKMLGLVCKWSDYQSFKPAIQEIEAWVVICGICQFNGPTVAFMKALAYACLPRKDGHTLTDKNLKALQVMLQLLHRKVYLLGVEPMTLLLKVIQALERYFVLDGQTVTREEVTNFSDLEQEVLNQYRLVREIFRNLFLDSSNLSSQVIEAFLQALTQVALDTLTKASVPVVFEPSFGSGIKQHPENTFEQKVFALCRVCTIATKNIHRIDQFWNLLTNFMLVHLGNKDWQLALEAVNVLYTILLELANHECRSRRTPDLKLVFGAVSEAVRSCQNERILASLTEGFMRLIQNHPDQLGHNMSMVILILRNIACHNISQQKAMSLLQKCLELCIAELTSDNDYQNSKAILEVVQILADKHDSSKRVHIWQLLGSLLHKLCVMHTEAYQTTPDEREIESDCESAGKSFCTLTRSPSLRHITHPKGFEDCFGQLMKLLIRGFNEPDAEQRASYMQVLTWTLMRHIQQLPLLTIKGALVPSMNRLLMLLVDHSVASAPNETPNFNTGRMKAFDIERQCWQLLTHRFVTVYRRVVEVVGFVYRSGKLETLAAKIAEAVISSTNACLLKKNIQLLAVFADLLHFTLEELPAVALDYASLLSKTKKLIDFMAEEEGSFLVITNMRYLPKLELLVATLGRLVLPKQTKDQTTVLLLIDALLLIIQTHCTDVALSPQLAQCIAGMKLEAVKDFIEGDRVLKTASKDLLAVELDKAQFRHRISQRIKSTQPSEPSSHIPCEEDSEGLFSCLLQLKPKMEEGLISFLKQSVGVDLASAEQQEEFALRVLPLLLTEQHRHDAYCLQQMRFLTALLLSSHKLEPTALAVSDIYRVHQKIELLELLIDLIRKALSGLLESLREARDQQKLASVRRLVGILANPQTEAAQTKQPYIHVRRCYDLLLQCLQLKDSELTSLSVNALRHLTPTIQS